MPETVIVTEKEFLKAEDIFRGWTAVRFIAGPREETALAALVVQERARAVIVGVDAYSGPLYEALHTTGSAGGALIARFGVGHDRVDKALARQNGVLVCNTPGALDLSVAEHVIWLLGSLARGVSQAEANMIKGKFEGRTGREMQGKRLGILGFGNIGRKVAAATHFGLGMEVWAAGTKSVEALEKIEQRRLADLQKTWGIAVYTTEVTRLLAECDYVSVHLPAIPSTRHFINAARLGLMPPSASLINTARGWVVDETALYDALAEGHLAGAALDVFENEPYRPVTPEKDLRTLGNIVLTPHIGSNTVEANQRMAGLCVKNVTHFFAGRLDQITLVPVAMGKK
jgi:lactate dehydrogenase-like 2-hydroxyacid dehydrogenase